MITRKQFRELWNQYQEGMGDHNSPLWFPESNRDYSRWFVKVRPIDLSSNHKKNNYFLWCDQFCKGQVLCYSSDTDNEEEWWGFTHKRDIVMWILKWS